MKKIFSVVTASVFVAGLMGLTPAVASENIASQTELVLSEVGNDWSLALQDTANGSETVISDALRGDRGTIVDSGAVEANYVKYQGLGVDDGLAAAVLVSGQILDLAWSPTEVDSEVSVVVNGAPVSIDQTQSSASVEVPLGVTVDVSVQATSTEPSASTGLYTTEFSQFSLATPTSLSAAAISAAAFAVVLPSKSTFRQNTFIPDVGLALPPFSPCTPPGNSLFRFVGDNRGFSPNDGASFRTRMDAVISWGASPSTSFTKLVGTTILQQELAVGAWLEVARATASSTPMQMSVLSSTSTYVRFKLTQDVVNPFCDTNLTNGISSTTTVTIYRSGAVSGTLSYLAMPNYEVYLRPDSGGFSPLAQLNNMGFPCLIKGPQSVACNQTVSLP